MTPQIAKTVTTHHSVTSILPEICRWNVETTTQKMPTRSSTTNYILLTLLKIMKRTMKKYAHLHSECRGVGWSIVIWFTDTCSWTARSLAVACRFLYFKALTVLVIRNSIRHIIPDWEILIPLRWVKSDLTWVLSHKLQLVYKQTR